KLVSANITANVPLVQQHGLSKKGIRVGEESLDVVVERVCGIAAEFCQQGPTLRNVLCPEAQARMSRRKCGCVGNGFDDGDLQLANWMPGTCDGDRRGSGLEGGNGAGSVNDGNRRGAGFKTPITDVVVCEIRGNQTYLFADF